MDTFKSVANVKYKLLDDALSKDKYLNRFQVDLTPLKAFAVGELQNLGLKKQSSSLKTFLTDILNEPNYTTYKRANILRGDLLEESRAFTTETLGKKKEDYQLLLVKK